MPITFAKAHLLATQGHTSRVTRSDCGDYVLKKLKRYRQCDLFKREKFVLEMLNSHGIAWAPNLVASNERNQTLVMTYCGTPISKELVASDPMLKVRLVSQFKSVLSDMARLGLEHCDIKEDELLMHDGNLMICDFGWAKLNGSHSMGCGLWDGMKPSGYYSDETALERCYPWLVPDTDS